MNVDAIVEGSVLRSGEQVRITAQLIQVPVDKHLWAESYEGNLSDTLALQNKVAQAVAEQIRIEVTSQERAELKRVKKIDPDAYEVVYFNQAIAQDPNYAAAYSGLADTFALLGD